MLTCLYLFITACSQNTVLPSHKPASSTVAQPNSTLPPTPLSEVTPQPLGVVPLNCSSETATHSVFSALGPVVGQAPIWAAGFDGPFAVLHIPASSDTYTRYGWAWKLIWEVEPHFSQKITLHGGNLRTREPLWFQFNGPTTLSPVLDPQQPEHPTSVAGEGYTEWGTYVFIATAGCYQIEAAWSGGQGRIVFAAGRQEL